MFKAWHRTPTLVLYRGTTPVVTNADWQGATALIDAFSRTGAFMLPADSRDAAVVASLEPGTYSVQVTNNSGLTGTTLVEVYEVP